MLANVFITFYHHSLYKWIDEHPIFFGLDILFSVSLLLVSGGIYSPYYLYALSPLLASAYFFNMRGAILVSLIFTPLYVISIFSNLDPPLNQLEVNIFFLQLGGIWLITLLLGFPTELLEKNQRTNDELSDAKKSWS